MSDATNQLERFERNLDTYGADLNLWPPVDREAGVLALQRSAQARALHAEALRLAEVLLQIDPARKPIEPSAALLRNLAEIPLRHPRRSHESRRVGWWPFATVYKPVVALAAAAALGVVAGSVVPDTWGDEPNVPAWASLAEDGDGEGSAWTPRDVDELSALAFGLDLEEAWNEEGSP